MADTVLPAELKYDGGGLLTVVVQHRSSGQVLMVGHANREAVERTLASGKAWFFSRSRQRLWQKGETSGNVLDIVAVRVDCDGDALIYECVPNRADVPYRRTELLPSCAGRGADGRDQR